MLSELSVQVVQAALARRENLVFLLLLDEQTLIQFLLLENVGEFFADQVLLLFIENVDLRLYIVKPRVQKHFFRSETLVCVLLEHALH